MQSFTTTKVAKVLDFNGPVVVDSEQNQSLSLGLTLEPGAVLSLPVGAEVTLAFEDGSLQKVTAVDSDAENNLIVETLPNNIDFASLDNIQGDIEAIQALIQSGNDLDLPDTAAGGIQGNQGTDFVTLNRDGDELLAEAGYDTTEVSATTPENDDPELAQRSAQPTITQSDFNTVAEDTIAAGNVLDNDSDLDDALTVQSFSVAGDATVYTAGQTAVVEGGTIVLNTDGSYTFTPNENFNGLVPVVTYTTNTGSSDTLTIEVTPVSDLIDDNESVSTAEDTSVSGNLLTNASSSDGTPVVTGFNVGGTTYSVGDTAALTEGNLTINADGSYTFVPAANYNGAVPVATYTVEDGVNSDTSTLSIGVTPASDLTDANESVSTAEDTSVSGNVLTNASSADGTPVVTGFNVGGTTYSVGDTAALTEGSLTINQDGSYTFLPSANFNGTVPVTTYTVSDGENTDTSTLTINITPVSDLSDADEVVTTAEDTTVTGNLLTNASSADGTPAVTGFTVNGTTYSVGDTASLTEGNLTINSDGSYTFVPAANFNGTVPAATYTVEDGVNTENSTLSIEVTPESDLTDADESVSTAEDTTVTGNVLTNASSADGTPTVTGFIVGGTNYSVGDTAALTEGNLTINSDGSYTFVPVANFNGTVPAATYTVEDGINSDTSTLSIEVTNVNQLPDAVNDSFNMNENATLTGNVVGNDDLGDEATTVTAFDSASANGGTVNVNPDGTFSYTPAADFTGADTFTYTITDADGDTSSATVTVNVANVNQLPDAVNDSFNMNENATLTGNVIGNDDLGDEATTVTAFDSASANGGTINVNPDGTFSYTPAADFVGADTFTYTITDADGDTSSATVTVNVANVNQLPDAVNDSFNINENTALTGNVIGNDDLGDEATTVTSFDSTSVNGGTVNVNPDGTFSYTPAADFVGADTFTYTITDADGDTSTATVTVNVANVNQLPDAVNDSFNINENTALTGNVIGNDDLGDEATTVTAFDSASANGGTVNVNPDGTFSYTPAADFVGADTFTYTITDADGDTSSATVTVNVANVNQLPDAVNDSFNMNENATLTGNVIGNDDLGDEATTVTAFDSASANGGTVNVNPDGTFSYTPAADFVGADTFTYTITDADGDTSSATVTVNVANVNQLPDAVNDSFNINENTALTGNVIGNDDLGDEATTVTAFDSTSVNGGTVNVNPDGTFSYTPVADFVGADTFTYTITDADGDTSTATVTVNVANVNQLPDAVNDSFDINENTALTGNVIGNDDLGDEATTVTSFDSTSVNGGTVNVNPDGTFSYTPAADFVGADTFTYTITDADGDTSTATVTVNIANVNQLPDAVNDSFDINENTALTGSVIGNDDLGDEATTVTAFDSASTNGGTVNVNPDGTFSYTPAADFVGADTFTYTITDADGDTSTATVTVNVANVNAPPVANNDQYQVDDGQAVTGNVIDGDGVSASDSDGGDGANLSITGIKIGSTTHSISSGQTITVSLGNGTLTINSNGEFTYSNNGFVVGDPALTFDYTLSDGTDSDLATVIINVNDDGPKANNDYNEIDLSGNDTLNFFGIKGNVATGLRKSSGDELDERDSDDTINPTLTQVIFHHQDGSESIYTFNGNNPLKIDTPFGTLTIETNGFYTFRQNGKTIQADDDIPEKLVFTYTIQDGDAVNPETDTADLIINISAPSNPPSTQSKGLSIDFDALSGTIDTDLATTANAEPDDSAFVYATDKDADGLNDILIDSNTEGLESYLAILGADQNAGLSENYKEQPVNDKVTLEKNQDDSAQLLSTKVTNGLLADGAIIVSDAVANPSSTPIAELDSPELL